MKKIFLVLMVCSASLLLAAQKKATANESYLLVGTYTSAKSDGIYVYKFNSDDGSFTPVSNASGFKNPSFLAVSPNEKYVFAVNETGGKETPGMVTAFSFDKKTGSLTKINQQPSGGDHPCYVAVDKTGKWIALANYSGGSLEVLPVAADGGLGLPFLIQHEGKSVTKRQEKAHVHSTVFSPDNKFIFVPDLGQDKIFTYSFNAATGKTVAAEPAFTATEPGTGPRHFAFSPSGKFGYVITELTGTVNAYSYDGKGKLTQLQSISSHPSDFSGIIGSADIHVSPDGKFLYASNRGSANSIAIFAIDQSTGKLTSVGFQSTLGKTPRNFNFDPSGNFLLAANQDTDDIIIFKIDRKTGLLTDTGKKIEVGKPVCVKWASLK
jgi:6-phosphogluconolactonase